MSDQHLKSNNSKLEGLAAHAVPVLAGLAALMLGAAALALPPALAGRLHPAAVPAALCLVLALTAAWTGLNPAPAGPEAANQPPSAGLRPLLCAGTAVLILALATRPLGLVLASFAAVAVAAYGVVGVTVGQALRIGLALAVGLACVLAPLRQPLPLLPPGLGW